jgi:hypothetical protein
MPDERPASSIGLCASCAHSAVITSSRGSVFYMCRLSLTDPAFPKYPRLPVVACAGYTRRDENPAPASEL